MQRINIRLDTINEVHSHCTIFMNGANCGKLTFRLHEYRHFVECIMLGSQQLNTISRELISTVELTNA